jgi:hypothetical protein
MTTLTISVSGSGLLPDTAQVFTLNDADLQSVFAWGASAFNAYIQSQFNPSNTQGFTPTNAQIFPAVANNWKVGVINAVQNFETVPAIVPPDIIFA